jgi:hypothetical protein
MIWVTAGEYLHDYLIRVRFSDGTECVLDLEQTIFGDHRPIFSVLRDQALFRRFRVDMDTLVWENGLDLAPEYLYELATGAASRTKDESGPSGLPSVTADR